MCIGKSIFRTALIGGLALGGATLLLGPERVANGFSSVRGKVQETVDAYVSADDDPVAIRRQLQKVADQLPEQIGELRGELGEVDRQIAMMERDSEVAQGVIAMTSGEISDLQTLVARAEATAESTAQTVAVRFDGRRFNVNAAKRELQRISNIRQQFEDRLAMNLRDLDYLSQQRDRLTEYLTQLETEQDTITAQMYQIDRKIEAIARNEKLVESLEEREEALAGFNSSIDLSSLEAIQAKLEQWEVEVDARLQRFDQKTDYRDYENEVKRQLQQREHEEFLDEFDADWNDEIEEASDSGDSVVLGPRIIE